MEWSTLGCPVGNTPAHHYSLKGGPVEKASPANSHNLSLTPFAKLDQAASCFQYIRQSLQLSMKTVSNVKN